MNIYKKLFNIQQELKAPKNLYNKFGNYNYRSTETILEAAKPLLKTNNLILLINDDVQEIGGKNYIKATTKLIDIETGESIENSALAREDETRKKMDSPQITGSCSLYARKYALNGLFMIDDVKDSDATNKHGKDEKEAKEDTTTFAGPESKKNNVKNIWTQPKKTSQTITETQVKQLYATGLNAGFNAEIIEKQIQKKFNKGIKELNSNEYYQAYNGYKQMVIGKLTK
ncbi:ERF family protein [Intestinibacter bartlettii]|uniref:ERF family protein n=1 Tax=Intestinibacter bartlettii TaxID=261299 RepID=UPI0008221312|nr:ERF family protein [Intestinibacter bartlettii]SCI47073.1 ERF superfamily [uncultured Clostridium sp.]